MRIEIGLLSLIYMGMISYTQTLNYRIDNLLETGKLFWSEEDFPHLEGNSETIEKVISSMRKNRYWLRFNSLEELEG